jgi:hypothetical protein
MDIGVNLQRRDLIGDIGALAVSLATGGCERLLEELAAPDAEEYLEPADRSNPSDLPGRNRTDEGAAPFSCGCRMTF